MLGEDKIVRCIADAALEEKALDLIMLDVRELTILADYFVIASGRSSVQIRSIAENIEKKMAELGIDLLRRDGYQESKWVVLDYGSWIVHVFHPEQRDYYKLEDLWGDAPAVQVDLR
ncbi:MAG TPA: ribosome silencing factor [Syntrophomonadaceae bacterium]|nr:ribosome silencing factor [Syntrophomonadaceae bacterium]